jgi:hypothetical protein
MQYWSIPAGADKVSEKHIEQMKAKLGHMVITDAEIKFIIDGIMKAQVPRDLERIKKMRDKEEERARKKAALASMRKSR